MAIINSFRDLIVFRDISAYFSLAMDIFEVSKVFPREEKYSLTEPDTSFIKRSISANIAEGYGGKKS